MAEFTRMGFLWTYNRYFEKEHEEQDMKNRYITRITGIFLLVIFFSGCAGSVRYQWKLEDEIAHQKLKGFECILRCDSLIHEIADLKRHVSRLKMDSLYYEWGKQPRRSKDF